MQKYVKRIGDERLGKVPADLDLKPYRDEHDDDLVRRMLQAIARGKAPAGLAAAHLRAAVARHLPQLERFAAKARARPPVGKGRARKR
jgi:hypothetical protein